MANAKKCDRCGKYYDEYGEDMDVMGNLPIGDVNGIALVSDEYNRLSLDICPMCMIQFVDWLNAFDPIVSLTFMADTDGRCAPADE